MGLLETLVEVGQELAKVPGLLEALVGIATAAKDGDADKVRAESERLATLAAYRASYRV